MTPADNFSSRDNEDLSTTLGYVHLAKGETERAIRLLDEPINGNLMATEESADLNK